MWLFLREISFLARRLDYTKGRQGGGSAAASRAKLPQQMLCRRVECAVVAHQRHAHIGKAENLQHGIMDTMGALKRNEQ